MTSITNVLDGSSVSLPTSFAVKKYVDAGTGDTGGTFFGIVTNLSANPLTTAQTGIFYRSGKFAVFTQRFSVLWTPSATGSTTFTQVSPNLAALIGATLSSSNISYTGNLFFDFLNSEVPGTTAMYADMQFVETFSATASTVSFQISLINDGAANNNHQQVFSGSYTITALVSN